MNLRFSSLLAACLLWAGQAIAAVDINTATRAQLDGLKGIGPAKAQAILDYRRQHGPFQSIDDLMQVPGIGPAILDDIRRDITVGKPRGSTPRALPAPIDAGPREQAVIDGRSGMRIGGLSGSFRTMCVRTCDGYYFPVSWSVPQAAFERDARACEAMCPGTQVELHYHRVSGEDSEDMVSAVTGAPYRQMTNAFLYRKPNASVPSSCGCGAAAQEARGFETIGGDYGNDAATFSPDAPQEDQAVTAAIPLPSVRPDAAEDPETLATREGGLDAAGLKKLATPPPARPTATHATGTGERQVRVVGPAFLPGPEEAIDLQAPAPAHGR